MGRRHSHHSKNKKFLFSLIIIFVAIAIGSALWSTCRTKQAAHISTPESDLLQVKLPTALDQQLINYPGFTVSFNPRHHQPNYSAWQINVNNIDGNIPRGKKFTTDPNIKGCATTNDYRNSGYDRGHMAPAGDMKWDQQAMDACFNLTNICPQAKSLNTKAWKNLETKCRQWARRDSVLIVICGPILTDRLTKTIGDTHITVPDRFFKVILAPYANPPRAIGFIMPNGTVPGGIQQAAVSVDEVEATTGMDFFSSLPDDIETQVEAQCDFPKWEYTKKR